MPSIRGILSVQLWFPNQVNISLPSHSSLSKPFPTFSWWETREQSLALPAAADVFRELEMSSDLCHVILPKMQRSLRVLKPHTASTSVTSQTHTKANNRVLPRTGHSKHPLPRKQEKTLHMDITRWSTPKSDWFYSLQPKMEKLYTVS